MFYRNGLIPLINSIADLMAPPRCNICSNLIDSNSDQAKSFKKFCGKCDQKIATLRIKAENRSCSVCKRVVCDLDSEFPFCGLCSHKFQENLFLFSLYRYESEVKKLIKIIKYENDTSTSWIVAEQLLTELISINRNLRLGSSPLLIPIPSTHERIILRGFDSTFYITKQIQQKLKFPLIEFKLMSEEGDYKISDNPLSRLDKDPRKYKIKNKKNYTILKNQNIILIDDVITTGSTALGLAQFLQKMGVNKILILTIARSVNFTKFYLNLDSRNGQNHSRSQV